MKLRLRRKRRTVQLSRFDVDGIGKGLTMLTRLFETTGVKTLNGVFCNGDWGSGVIPVRFDEANEEYVIEWTR